MTAKIWLIGGTSESVIVANLLIKYGLNFVVSVTTNSACKLYPFREKHYIFVGKLEEKDIPEFIQKYKIQGIIDCSHPFAKNISQLAMAVANNLNLFYLRYERPLIETGCYNNLSIIEVDDFPDLVNSNSPLAQKRVLLTIGAKFLSLFKDYHSQATLFCRILPYPSSLSQAYEAGFSCDRIIALRPPFTEDLEKALWQWLEIEMVVSKAGGEAGGEAIKYQVATALGIPLIVVKRPKLDYPFVTSDLKEVEKIILFFDRV